MSERDKAEQRGFTIIELLVVIAIMAVLMAMVFPLASGMKQRGNQTACIGNLQNIGQALKLYRLDERDYPFALYGYVVDRNVNDLPDDEPTTFLYPHYSRARRDFKCPSNPNRDNETQFSGAFQGRQPGRSVPLMRVPKQGGGYTVAPITNHKIFYFIFDSYDGGVLPPIRTSLNPVPVLTTAQPTPSTPLYEQHYRHDWGTLFGVPLSRPLHPLATRELMNRNPEDSTYVTTCSYRREYRTNAAGFSVLPNGPASTDIVLFLDGHTEKIPSSEVATTGPLIQPKQS